MPSVLPHFLAGCLLAGMAAALAAEKSVAVAIGREGDAFVVDATVDAPVSQRIAWEVLVDYDHMADILTNLSSSRVVSRDGDTLVVKQEGTVRVALFSYSFQSEREIRLEPIKRILVRNLSGSVKRMDSETRLVSSDRPLGVHLTYHAEIVPDSLLARLFGGSFVHDGIEEQFQRLVAEMKRREARLAPATPQLPQ